MSVRVEPAAALDLADAIHWYELQYPGLGAEFLRSIDACFDRLSRLPSVGVPLVGEVRRTSIRRFPFVVFYLAEPDGVVILAVIHAARDPDWIRRRLR